jgi:predicted DNA-binding ribbon-helix-helix protein
MATQEEMETGERPMTLAGKITVLKKEIAHCWALHAAAEGDKIIQNSLLATITVCRASLRDYEQRQERRLGQQQIHQPQPQAQTVRSK